VIFFGTPQKRGNLTSSEVKNDQEWLLQVKQNGGIIVSVDGIQEDKRQRDGLRGT